MKHFCLFLWPFSVYVATLLCFAFINLEKTSDECNINIKI